MNNNKINELSGRKELSDFSTQGYIFDDNSNPPYYLGEEDVPTRQHAALKYGFYVLVNELHPMFESYTLLEKFTSRKDNIAFCARIRRGLEELYLVLRERVTEICKEMNFRLDHIALTIPAEWTLEFEDVYRDIVASVFQHPLEAITFVTETEALVHYLFKHCTRQLQLYRKNVENLFILDFGGHSMVCT